MGLLISTDETIVINLYVIKYVNQTCLVSKLIEFSYSKLDVKNSIHCTFVTKPSLTNSGDSFYIICVICYK